jgi:hypothetical protein
MVQYFHHVEREVTNRWRIERWRMCSCTELRSLNASETCFSEAPPPTSKKFAGEPKHSKQERYE